MSVKHFRLPLGALIQELLQGDCVGLGESASLGAMQCRNVTADPELFAKIAGDTPDIGPFAAVNIHIDFHNVTQAHSEQVKTMNRHRTTCPLHHLAAAGEFIKRLPIDLQRRNHGRHLVDCAAKPSEGGFDRCLREMCRGRRCYDFTL